MKNNVDNVKKIFTAAAPEINFEDCSCRKALEGALV
jgi:hypothetical protein